MGSGQIDMGQPLDLTMIDLWQRPSICCWKLQLVSDSYLPIIRLCPDTKNKLLGSLPGFIWQSLRAG